MTKNAEKIDNENMVVVPMLQLLEVISKLESQEVNWKDYVLAVPIGRKEVVFYIMQEKGLNDGD